MRLYELWKIIGRPISTAALMMALGVWQAANAENLLLNGGFDEVDPSGLNVRYTTTAPGAPGPSSALNWSVFMNTPGSIQTRLFKSPHTSGGKMIGVFTDGDRNGIVNRFGTDGYRYRYGYGPDSTFACVWIYIRRGEVMIGTGNGGQTRIDMRLRKTGSWEYMPVSNGVSPANEFIIYSVGRGGAEFFVESAQVSRLLDDRYCSPPE